VFKVLANVLANVLLRVWREDRGVPTTRSFLVLVVGRALRPVRDLMEEEVEEEEHRTATRRRRGMERDTPKGLGITHSLTHSLRSFVCTELINYQL
jgi:hypothetical protein